MVSLPLVIWARIPVLSIVSLLLNKTNPIREHSKYFQNSKMFRAKYNEGKERPLQRMYEKMKNFKDRRKSPLMDCQNQY